VLRLAVGARVQAARVDGHDLDVRVAADLRRVQRGARREALDAPAGLGADEPRVVAVLDGELRQLARLARGPRPRARERHHLAAERGRDHLADAVDLRQADDADAAPRRAAGLRRGHAPRGHDRLPARGRGPQLGLELGLRRALDRARVEHHRVGLKHVGHHAVPRRVQRPGHHLAVAVVVTAAPRPHVHPRRPGNPPPFLLAQLHLLPLPLLVVVAFQSVQLYKRSFILPFHKDLCSTYFSHSYFYIYIFLKNGNLFV
jgi:hypothetical protein